MSKLGLVARQEYKQHVLKKGFVLAVLSLPLLVVLILGTGTLAELSEYNGKDVGYVDFAGLLANPIPAPSRQSSPMSSLYQKPVAMVAYQTEEAARSALDAGDIQAYYVLAGDYFESRLVELVYDEPPGKNARRQFWIWVQVNLAANRSPDVAYRVAQGSLMTVRTPDGIREHVESALPFPLVGLLVSLAMMILLLMNAGTLMDAVVREKENRTMEVLVTSISPYELMAGKVVGIVGVGLTQLAGWAVGGGLLVYIGAKVFGLEWVQTIRMPPGYVLTIGAVVIPSYVLFGAVMAALGATVADSQESQQVGGLSAIPFMAPLWLMVPIIKNPNGPLAIVLTLFPTTAVSTLCLRASLMQVPLWQVVTSVALLCASALGAIWLAARAFRLGMLRYGQRLKWRELFGRRQSVGTVL